MKERESDRERGRARQAVRPSLLSAELTQLLASASGEKMVGAGGGAPSF